MSAFVQSPETRNWLRKHGKRHFIDFDESERLELRKYFMSLDTDGSGSIGVDELEEPLISLGLAQNRRDVQELITSVDVDNSGEIEFEEFLCIIKGGDQDSTITTFFKNMVNGNLLEDSQTMPFHLLISSYRRKQMLKNMGSKSTMNRDESEKMMRNYGIQLSKKRKKGEIDIKYDSIMNAAMETVEGKIGFPDLPRIIDSNTFSKK